MMSVYFDAILEPGDMRSRGPFCCAEEGYFVAQYVLKVEVRSEKDFCALFQKTIIYLFIFKTCEVAKTMLYLNFKYIISTLINKLILLFNSQFSSFSY